MSTSSIGTTEVFEQTGRSRSTEMAAVDFDVLTAEIQSGLSMHLLSLRFWKSGWQGKVRAERRHGIDHDVGGVPKAKGRSSGLSVQEVHAFLRGGEGVGKLVIVLAGKYN